ncbi:MAG: hypothetical protein HFI32_00550 [Lachnospiraceae bacterium]|nr:hypothetical protein [Lachnospiraceae bacterium]
MDNLYTASLIQKLSIRNKIFICGPSLENTNKPFQENHLRVYANGGILCLLPTTKDSLIKIPSFAYLGPEQDSQDQEDPRVSDAIEAHFSRTTRDPGKLLSPRKILSAKERHNQIAIARNHRDFHPDHRGTVVCDFEMTLPEAWYKRGSHNLQIPGKRHAKCDLVTFSCAQKPWVISIVELKCNKRACTSSKNGLSVHAKEMTLCMEETKLHQESMVAVHNQTDYIKEILRRLGYMLGAGLLENAPAGLEAKVKELSRSEDREWIRSQVQLRSCFLFTRDDTIPDARAAADLCQKADYLNTHLEDFCYQFQEDPALMDLSRMQSWEEFTR